MAALSASASTPAQRPLYGRSDEQAALEQLLADARLGSSAAIVVSGEPGIGKSALLEWAADRGWAEGMEVLSARGVESEAEVPFGGLLELLRPALGELERIPAPQAEALRGALDMGPTAERERIQIGAATLNLLSARSEQAPLVVIVDDAHWLDDSSLAAVLFASRRLLVDPVIVIFATRTGQSPELEAARLPEVSLGGLSSQAASEIVAEHAASQPPPGSVERLRQATGGNPLALVELASIAGTLDAPPLDGPLEIETSVADAYAQRIVELPTSAQRMMALAAAEESGRLAWIGAAAQELELELADLEPAEREELLSISFGALSWRHPLVRTAAYRAVSAAERRAMHDSLAKVLPASELDRRVWHRAAAALGADEEVATALEQLARRARARSAYAAAATAAERAARLSESDASRAPRLVAAAEAAWLGGYAARSLSRLEEALALSPEPPMRAEIAHLRGQVTVQAGDAMAGHEILVDGAAGIEKDDPGKAVVMLAEATYACVYAGRPGAMLAPARRAFELLAPDADERQRFLANLALGAALIYGGEDREGTRRLEAASEILLTCDVFSGNPRSLAAPLPAPLWLREAKAGLSLIDQTVEVGRVTGALGAFPLAIACAARDAIGSDRWALGRAWYGEAIDVARETGQALPLCGALAGLATLQARVGDTEGCEASAHEALVLSETHGLGLFRLWALDALAECELGRGRLDPALDLLEQKAAVLSELELTDPDFSSVPEQVEASIRAGRDADLEAPMQAFASAAELKGQPWARARLERARGLLAGPDTFAAHFSSALELHAATRDRFEEARTRLCYGERLRRAGQRVRAREQLRPALAGFESLGAEPWLERARAELLATGERARRRDPTTLDDLTPQELQIAYALAGSLTTREAAAKFFLSPKTIEYHLRNTYRKLGIHSREELAEALAEGDLAPDLGDDEPARVDRGPGSASSA